MKKKIFAEKGSRYYPHGKGDYGDGELEKTFSYSTPSDSIRVTRRTSIQSIDSATKNILTLGILIIL